MDTNSDNVLSFDELFEAFGRDGAIQILEQSDHNNDGRVTIHELRQDQARNSNNDGDDRNDPANRNDRDNDDDDDDDDRDEDDDDDDDDGGNDNDDGD